MNINWLFVYCFIFAQDYFYFGDMHQQIERSSNLKFNGIILIIFPEGIIQQSPRSLGQHWVLCDILSGSWPAVEHMKTSRQFSVCMIFYSWLQVTFMIFFFNCNFPLETLTWSFFHVWLINFYGKYNISIV